MNDYRKPVIIPTVNSNGSSAESLLGDLEGAIGAIRNAISAMSQVTPHGRDYQTSPIRGAAEQARADHIDRVQRLQSVYDELVEIAIGVSRQKRNRS